MTHDVHLSNSLQVIKQNHWTLKCRSCSPWPHNTWVNVIKSSDASLTAFKNILHNRKAEKHFLKMSRFLTSSPTPGHEPRGQESWNESRLSRVPMFQIWMLSDEGLPRSDLEKNLAQKTLPQCDENANDRGDYNYSTACTSYRWAKQENFLQFSIKVLITLELPCGGNSSEYP